MTKGDFIDRIDKIRPLLYGYWREIAKKAGVTYTTVQQYSKGIAPVALTRIKIITACEEVLNEIKEKITEVTCSND